MHNRKFFISALLVAVLLFLCYLQFRTWRNFDWAVFYAQTRDANKLRFLAGLLLIYGGYILRALRWKLFLKPRKQVAATRLVAPQFIGFAALVILGRAGDVIRPYLIARKEDLSFSSQLAVLMVERVCDIAAFALILTADLVFASSLQQLPPQFVHAFRIAGFALLGLVAVLSATFFAIWKSEDRSARWFSRILRPISPRAAESVFTRVHSFGQGLHTIHDFSSLAQILGLSIGLWGMIALAYLQVTHAYPVAQLHSMRFSQVILIMAASVAGSTLQLPVVGGGSQLGTITVMEKVFLAPKELAASCGLTLWLLTVVSVLPVGALLARREHLSLRRVSEESHSAAPATIE